MESENDLFKTMQILPGGVVSFSLVSYVICQSAMRPLAREMSGFA